MMKQSKILIGIQTIALTLALTAPAQAAIIVGGTQQYSGSVVKISYPYYQNYNTTQPSQTPTTTPTTTTPTTTTPTTTTPTTSPTYSSKISLKYYYYNRTTTPAPAPTPTEPAPAPAPAPAPTPTPTEPTPTPAPAPTEPAPAPTPSDSIPNISALSVEEQQMVDMVNKERIAAGLQPLQVDMRLASVARAKAIDLKENNYFAHQSPTYGSPFEMMKQAGISYRYAGENLAMNRTVAAAMTALMNSSGHKANILNPKFTHIGIGISSGSSANYYVQMFIQK